jgi:ribonuclease D
LELDRPRLVATAPELIRLVKEWKREPVLAVDTEAASFHRYLNRIYLVQVSTRTTTSIIDPVAIEDLSPFGEILADPKIEVVFHDADYDLRLFDYQYGFKVRSLFDTRTAAELLSEPGLSLAALLERYFDVKIDKRFQRADWSARPLTEEMLAYAAADTRNLVALRDLLAERLEQTGRLAWAKEEFARLEHVRWTVDEDREPAWLRIKGAKALRPRQLAILRELHAWRVGQATRLDRAEFRILGNDALLMIAREAPESPEALGAIRGVGRDTAERRGRNLLAAVRRGLKVPEHDLPTVPRPPRRQREPEIEARTVRLKSVRTEVAARLGLDPGVICPNSVLDGIARANPTDLAGLRQVEGLKEWQVREFGKVLLGAIKTP